jgi:hypothetical protein
MKMMKNKIAKYARMASNEAHEEYMQMNPGELAYYMRDILSEQIDKFDRIEAMANRRWYDKLLKKFS